MDLGEFGEVGFEGEDLVGYVVCVFVVGGVDLVLDVVWGVGVEGEVGV